HPPPSSTSVGASRPGSLLPPRRGPTTPPSRGPPQRTLPPNARPSPRIPPPPAPQHRRTAPRDARPTPSHRVAGFDPQAELRAPRPSSPLGTWTGSGRTLRQRARTVPGETATQRESPALRDVEPRPHG